jgi:HlyD family secretion protein
MDDVETKGSSEDRASLFGGVLENMSAGVMTLDLQGRILTFNQAAIGLLGVAREAALGNVFAAVFFGEEGFDAFNEAVLDAIYQSERVHRRVVEIVRDGAVRQIDLTTTLQQAERNGVLEKLGVIVVFDDVTEVERLRAAERRLAETLKTNHAELQQAYLDLEQKTERLDVLARRMRWAQLGAGLFVVVAVAGVALATGALSLSGPADATTAGAMAGRAASGMTMTVTARPIRSSISVVGTLRPGANVNVVGPFDGSIRDVRFAYGGTVERGAVVAVMDARELEVRAREARAAYIRAQEQVAELESWTTGAEVSRATRQLGLARQQLADLQRRAAETKRLLGQGIVAEDDYRSVQQQLASQELQVLSAEQDVEATKKRGDGNKLGVARLELENARVKTEELEAQLARADIRAPVSGIALIPATGSGAEGGRSSLLERGARVQQGQTMFSIGDLETLSVQAKIDEVDIGKLKSGQAARVSGDAFAGMVLNATVTEISSQASGGGAGDRALPSFDVLASIRELTPEQRAKIRVGMSANLSIVTYDNPQALIVPATAIGAGVNGPAVWVVGADGKSHPVEVETGITTVDGVEILNGLKDGDVVLVDAGAGS